MGGADGYGESGRRIHVADVHCIAEIDFVELLHHRVGAIAAAVSVALVDEKFVIVKSEHLADAASSGEQVSILVRCNSAGDIERDDAQQLPLRLSLGSILDQGILRDTDEGLAVRRDGESFHTFICDAARGVA